MTPAKHNAIGLPDRLPPGWTTQPIKRLYDVELGKMLQNEPSTSNDIRRPYLRAANVTVRGIDVGDVREMWFSPADWERTRLRRGDLLISEGGDVGRPAIWSEELTECGIQNALNRARPVGHLSNGFLMYVLNSLRANGAIEVVCNKATIPHFTADKVGSTIIPVPPSGTQDRIVAYLDSETARIDTLIDRKQRFIDLLLEKRTALITNAVTKGLDPNAQMKDSEVDWIGSIPATWYASQLGQLLTRITYGFTNPMPVADDGPCMLTANDIGDGRVLYETARRTTKAAFDSALTDKSRPRPGDILLTKDGSLGRTAIADDTPACINQSVAILRVDPVKASNEFVRMALSAHNYQDRMILEAGGTAIKHIYITRLAKMPIALPPLGEQDEIVAATREETRKIDVLVERTETSIDLLREYRTALISAAVTGQIAIPGSEATEEVA